MHELQDLFVQIDMVLTFHFVTEFLENVFMKALTIHPEVGAQSAPMTPKVVHQRRPKVVQSRPKDDQKSTNRHLRPPMALHPHLLRWGKHHGGHLPLDPNIPPYDGVHRHHEKSYYLVLLKL